MDYKNKGNDIIIKHIGCGRINTVDNDYVIDEFTQGAAVDFRTIFKFYNEAHIYIVTHPESFGQSTIECAASGGLIVQPNGYIKNEIISKLHHYNIIDAEHINWLEIIVFKTFLIN